MDTDKGVAKSADSSSDGQILKRLDFTSGKRVGVLATSSGRTDHTPLASTLDLNDELANGRRTRKRLINILGPP